MLWHPWAKVGALVGLPDCYWFGGNIDALESGGAPSTIAWRTGRNESAGFPCAREVSWPIGRWAI